MASVGWYLERRGLSAGLAAAGLAAKTAAVVVVAARLAGADYRQ